MSEGFKEDALSIPDPNLEQMVKFGWNSAPPAGGRDNKYDGATAPSSLPGEPSHNQVAFTIAENDFPRQGGGSSLTDDELLHT